MALVITEVISDLYSSLETLATTCQGYTAQVPGWPFFLRNQVKY